MIKATIAYKRLSKCKAIPGEALRVPGGRVSQISRHLAHEGGKVVIPTHRPPLTPGDILGTHFFYRLSQTQGCSAAGRIMSIKLPMTLSGIEPATFRFVAQCLNQLKLLKGTLYVV